MACEVSRRQFLGAASLAAVGLALAVGLPTGAEPALAAPGPAAPPATGVPVVRLYMGMPEIDHGGRSVPYAPSNCPGRLVRDHADWWVC